MSLETNPIDPKENEDGTDFVEQVGKAVQSSEEEESDSGGENSDEDDEEDEDQSEEDNFNGEDRDEPWEYDKYATEGYAPP